jgi:hypothetical protein
MVLVAAAGPVMNIARAFPKQWGMVMAASRGADSEEKPEPASDIDAVMVDSLKVLDPER